jgi:6-phosphogluconolactonase
MSAGTGKIIPMAPSFLSLISPDRTHVYATAEGDKDGAVGAYAFEPTTGQLALLNSQSARGTCTCYVAEDKSGKWIFVANYCSGNIAALPVNTDGSLAPAVQVIQQYGKGKDTSRQESAHLHSTIFSPDEKFLLAADLGTDKEHVYMFNPGQNIPLREARDSVVSLKPGTGPRHIAFHPTKSDVYILRELSGTVDAFHFDNNSGKLTHFQRIRTTPESFKGDPGSADIHIRADGKFLYATNRGIPTRLPFLPYTRTESFPTNKFCPLKENIRATSSLIRPVIFYWLPIGIRIILLFFPLILLPDYSRQPEMKSAFRILFV